MTTQAIADAPDARVTLFPTEAQYQALDAADECATCHGQWVSVVDGSECPDCDGDPDAPYMRALGALEGQVEQLAIQLGHRIANDVASLKILREHAAQTEARIASRERRIEATKRWLALQMQSVGRDKVKDEHVTVYLQDNPESIEIIDLEQVPRAFKRATVQCPLSAVPSDLATFITNIDAPKTAIKEHLNVTGEVLPGCEFHAKGDTRHLRVRS